MAITHKPKAGALLTGTEYEASDSHLGSIPDNVTTVAATGAAETITWSATTQTWDVTLDQACTFTLAGATNGVASYLTIILRGAFATTWPASVTWLNGAPQATALRTVTLFTVNGGTNWYGTASRSADPVYAITRVTAGDFTLGTTAGTLLSGVSATVAATAGDLVMVGANGRNSDSDADSTRIDAATVVSAAAVNYLSSLTGTALTTGLPGWFFAAGAAGVTVSGEYPYVVQSGDISGGNVTFQLSAWGSGAGKNLLASTTVPLTFWVRNLG